MIDLSPLTDLIMTFWVAYGAVFLRVGTAIIVLPGLGETTIPARLRLAIALALTLVITPALTPSTGQTGLNPFEPYSLPQLLITEPLAGIAMGLVLRLFIIALQIAGTMIAQATSLAQMFGGGTGEPQPAVGHLLTIGGLALAFANDLHVHLVAYLIQSYQLIPMGVLLPAAALRDWSVAQTAHSFSLAFSIAAPFVIAALIYNVALGAINRAMPQLMVAFVGAPALTLGGLALMAIALPAGLMLWLDAMSSFLANPDMVLP